MEKTPIIDSELLEKMVRQSLNFDQLQAVIKAEADRIILKVIQPQITQWLRDLAQQVNQDVENVMKTTLGDPEKHSEEFKEELFAKIVEKIVSSDKNMTEFIKQLTNEDRWDTAPIAPIKQKLVQEIENHVRRWMEEHSEEVRANLSKIIKKYLEQPTSDLVRRELINSYNQIDDLRNRVNQLQNDFMTLRSEVQTRR
jgi:BMFP domain-containing protein YqiC